MNLTKYFACTKCKKKLNFEENSYFCKKCNAVYPVKHGIPIFLAGQNTDNYNEFWDSGWKKRFEEGDHSFHKKTGEAYNQIVSNMLDSARERNAAISFIEPISKNHLLLNIGCGMNEASVITMMGVNNYIGIDYSFSAAKYSHSSIKKLNGLGVTIQANAEVLPISTNAIDVVYSNGVLHHTPNIELTISEIFRVLKPSGHGIIGLYSKFSPKFIVARIVGKIKLFFLRKEGSWYEHSEEAWRDGDSLNPWTETFSKKQMLALFNKHDCEEIKISSNGFQWGDSFPIFGKYIAKTDFGKKSSAYLSSKIGSMWIVSFVKNS